MNARLGGGRKAWLRYRTIALKLPVMIHNEGLVGALHFVAARGNPEARTILDDLAHEVSKEGRADLLAHVRSLDAEALREQTREIQRRLGWYKRIVQAFGRDGEDPGASP